MQARLQASGWREIEVVDDDLGRSAAGTVTRAGFERMVAEVCLGKVGAVRTLQLQLEQHARPQDAVAPSLEEFQDLARDLEAVWNTATADMRLKKRIVRALVPEIVVDVDAAAGEV